MVKISLVIPIYNGELYLKEGISNILEQSFQDFELILVNDGSTDKSGEICDYYAMKDSRIRVIHKANEGAGPTRNKGIQLATGKYIMFPDCDDKMDKDMLKIMYEKIEQVEADLAICGYKDISISENGSIIENHQVIPEKKLYKSKDECRVQYISFLKQGIITSPWNKLYRLDIIRRHNIEYPDLRRCQDIVFNCRYFDKIEKCILLEDVLYSYKSNNIKGFWSKIPQNMFDIALEVHNTYRDKLNSWGVQDSVAKEYISNLFLKEVSVCILNAYNPNWEWGFKERYNYIKKLVTNPKVIKSINESGSDNKIDIIMNYMIKKKKVLSLMGITKIRVVMNTKCSRLLVRIKKL